MIKLIKYDGDWIVSIVEEVPDIEFGEPDCVLKYPHLVNNLDLLPYPAFSSDTELVVRSSNITIITEPSDKLANLYKATIKTE
jgi:hypothetical protein